MAILAILASFLLDGLKEVGIEMTKEDGKGKQVTLTALDISKDRWREKFEELSEIEKARYGDGD